MGTISTGNIILVDTLPTINSVSINNANDEITVTFSENVYTDISNNALTVNDFVLSLVGGQGELNNNTPTSISVSNNVVTLGISVKNTPLPSWFRNIDSKSFK